MAPSWKNGNPPGKIAPPGKYVKFYNVCSAATSERFYCAATIQRRLRRGNVNLVKVEVDLLQDCEINRFQFTLELTLFL